jgi:glycosyltransferase involved in cell wall biosynthesis
MADQTSKQETRCSGGRLLLVAYHFPPQSGSSGLLRSQKFCRYLPESGWRPVVLTVSTMAYETVELDKCPGDSEDPPVLRAFALDAKRHLSLGGFYPSWLALPDRWVSWVLGALPTGLRAIRKYKIDIIFTTFPICTAVLIGLILHCLSGRPWVLDLRDSMTEDHYPREPVRRRLWRWIERQAMRRAARVIFTAESSRKIYLKRYPELLSSNKCLVISNGYDEDDFQDLPICAPSGVPRQRPVRLLHSGLIYSEERDPRPMFRALARLKHEGRINSQTVQITFRAPGDEELYHKLLAENCIVDLFTIEPHIPYRKALLEAAETDGFLLFQAASCDHQIPAKAYEYLRIGKPIFALTTTTGDTAGVLREVGGATIVNLAEEEEIYRGFPVFLDQVREGTHLLPNHEKLRRYERQGQAEQLARVFADLIESSEVPDSEKVKSYAR